MAQLARSQALYAGALVHINLEVTSTSDSATKPASGAGTWLELACVEELNHFQLKNVEEFSCPDAQLGWRDRKTEHNTGDRYEVMTRTTTDLYERLSKGLSAPIVEDTAQTPGVAGERMLRAWVKIQTRMSDGNDNSVEDLWCEIRPLDTPSIAKGTQKPGFELWVLNSSLNAINYVDNS